LLKVLPSAFPAQPHDHVNARDLVPLGRGWCLADNHLGIRDVEYLIFAFDKEMMVRRRIGIEIGLRSIDRDLTEKSDFRELMQRVVNCCERDRHFRARRFFVEHLGGEMAIAFAEEPDLASYTGFVQDSGEGRWTVQAALEEAVPADVLSAALYARFRSRQEHTFADKVLSAMRFKFGGHVEKKP